MKKDIPQHTRPEHNGLPRIPVQRRSMERVARILDAADAIAREHGARAISAHSVAELSGVPAASVYQFFPTPDAILFGLSKTYIEKVDSLFDDTILKTKVRHWTDIIRVMSKVLQKFFEKYPHSAEIVLGSYRTIEIFEADKASNERFALRTLETFKKYDFLPKSPYIYHKILITIEIADAVWALSMRKYGKITNEMRHESEMIMISYLRNYIS